MQVCKKGCFQHTTIYVFDYERAKNKWNDVNLNCTKAQKLETIENLIKAELLDKRFDRTSDRVPLTHPQFFEKQDANGRADGKELTLLCA